MLKGLDKKFKNAVNAAKDTNRSKHYDSASNEVKVYAENKLKQITAVDTAQTNKYQAVIAAYDAISAKHDQVYKLLNDGSTDEATFRSSVNEQNALKIAFDTAFNILKPISATVDDEIADLQKRLEILELKKKIAAHEEQSAAGKTMMLSSAGKVVNGEQLAGKVEEDGELVERPVSELSLRNSFS